MIVAMVSVSAASTENRGKTMGMGSGSPSGLEFEPPLKARGRDMMRIVPVMLNVKTFFDGGSISFMLT
jgi:hypothetical protein